LIEAAFETWANFLNQRLGNNSDITNIDIWIRLQTSDLSAAIMTECLTIGKAKTALIQKIPTTTNRDFY
jgi:predicted Zn-dependent protease